MRYCIIDFYIDEPACLGVPPFFSTYPRYIAGALVSAGVAQQDIAYFTVDDLRLGKLPAHLDYCQAIFIIGGSTVPGRYLRTHIGSLTEILEFVNNQHRTAIYIGGPMIHAPQLWHSNFSKKSHTHIVVGDLEKAAFLVAKNIHTSDLISARRTTNDIAVWSLTGAFIIRQSRFFPNIVLEMESYRGCTRQNYCSFCSEKSYGYPDFRQIDHIIAEFDELIHQGASFFRLGRQADLLTFDANLDKRRHGFPQPNPESILKLYQGIRSLQGISLLHSDNINPGTIAHFPDESRAILETMVQYTSPGDTAALGLESLDDKVISANNLKVNAQQARSIIALIHKLGSQRSESGIPKLLPGINLIHGLRREDKNSFKINYLFLKSILDQGLLLRRINIRQVIRHQGAEMAKDSPLINRQSMIHQRFLYYRQKIRTEIDQVMLQRVFPIGSLLNNVIIESQQGQISWGRQLASYPITCKFFCPLNLDSMVQALVIGHDSRSLVCLDGRIALNTINESEIIRLPGIGKAKCSHWLLSRPFSNVSDFLNQIEPGIQFQPLIPWLRMA